ncbi:hypothetical protein PVA48_08230 [Akkermansia sp. JRP_AM1]|uniref:hypothetical protein n=1 Tax=Akkermansia sp. JRP_AM1 TaxID=3414159 RepID=UPI003BFA7510
MHLSHSCKLMKMKVLIRSLVLLAGLAAWTADTAWGQSSSRHSSSRGGTPVRQAAAQQRGEDDAVETVDLGDKKRESGTASGEREGVADAPEMPKETEKEQNGLDSLSLIPSLKGEGWMRRGKRTPARGLPPEPWPC